MQLFNTLIEIKTAKKEIPIKAVFIENLIWKEWTYYIYYYDIKNNTFYINDLDYLWTQNRTSATNIIEHIITKAHKQEKNLIADKWSDIYKNKKPKVFNIYIKMNWLIVIDKVDLKPIRWKKWTILWFKKPTWDISNSNNSKLQNIKNDLSNFYLNKPIN